MSLHIEACNNFPPEFTPIKGFIMFPTSDTIVIVDDIPALSFFVEHLLEEAGFTNYVSFDDPACALDFIKSNVPVDLVITDYYMPGMNGLELLEKAKSIRTQIQGIIISSASSLIPKENHDYIIMEKGKQLNQNLIGHVRKMIGG
jgi:CheY-like chemotaxis protein